ncbi:hypothetical protein B5F17_01830 [Butyricicoccus pullicaecorum]|uniref:Phage MuF C-terminal domain-containing protein n=1 Tax=Butyricicoccus pullicaecorum TaxID=501571 RepID=A0A1Y4LB76_9FIRM|nr:LPD38 domain-containing protein [Butyricicoccus pullicaecorum]OUP53975.1 hypothetical protein B5F17_01830 [Butyricicoccus pullicaecorum]
MALTSAEKKKKQEELNRQGKLYLQAKAKGDKRAMAAAHATADKIRKEAGWSYDAKTGTTYEKVSPIQKKGTVVNSKENLSMAKAGANPVKAVQQAAKKSSILTNSPASKSSVQQAKKAADTAAKKKAAPSTNKVLELGRGPIKTDGLTKSSVQKAVDAKRASTLNQLLQKRAQAQGTLPKTSMLAKDQAGPFSAIPVADALRNLTQGPLQMQKLNDKLAEQRTYKRQMEENLPSVEQALRAAIAGTKGSLGSAYETAKASVGNELAFLLDQGKNSLTRDLSDLGSDYKRKYGDATINFDGAASRAMRESARMRELATDDMGTVGKFLTDAGISIAQNAPSMALAALGPLGAAAGAAYMGTSAAGSKAYEVQANGGSANEALTRGIVSGLIEGVTEKFSIDSFLKSVQGTGTARQMIKNMLRQMGVEASEEGASYALNYLSDKVAKDPNATFSLAELAQNMGMGAVSGAVFGGLGSAARSVDADMLMDTQKNRGQVSIWDSVHEALGDERFAQAESEISTKNNKSTDPLLLNRLQLPDSMADGTLVTHSIAQEDAKSNSVSEALRWAMGETLKNPKIQQRNAYRAQIDAVFSGNMPTSKKIFLGDTPDVVAKYGMQAPLTMTQTTARKIAYPPGYLGGKHNLGIPALKHLPEQLADPIAILKSKTEGDSVVVLTAWNDTQGNPVIIPVHFGKDGTLTVENAIPSAYGKRNLEALFGENGENILYTKNNKSINQLLSSRLQLPNAMADDTLVAYSIAQAGVRNNQTGDVLRRVTGIENPPETAAEIRAAEQSAQAGMQKSMDYMEAWNAEAEQNAAQNGIPQAEIQADAQDTTGQTSPGRVKAAAKDLYRNFISGQAELEAVAKAQKKINPNRANAEDLVQMSRTADATVDMIAAGHMVDRAGNRMGDSWNDLVGALTPEHSELLNLYRQHKHNIDRMSLKEKAAPGLETVRNELAALRAQHPSMATLTESQLQEIARTEHGYLQVTALEFLDVIERERQLAAVTDKPVLGRREEGKSQTIPYTAEESRKIVQELEQAHPELKKQAEAIQRFHDDFMQEWAVGSGLMSQAQWQVLKDKYPDYVQTFRARDEWGNADITRRGRVDSMSPIRQAVGDISEIIPFEDAEMMQVNAIVKAARRNELFRNLYDFATEHPKQAAPFIRIKAQNSATLETMAGEYDSIIENVTQNAMRTENGSYQIIAMIDGKPVQMEVNAEIYAGLQNLYGQDRGASDAFGARIAKWVTNPFKQLTTGRNPLFFLSNFPKDFQTAYINTTSGRKTLAGYLLDVGGTIRSMQQNSAEWQTFQALGGKNSGFYHNEKGFRESAKTAEHRGVRRAVDMIGTPFEMVSENTEALWRFNEYRAAIRKYGDTQEGRAKAMQAAADVTTNFSRSAPMAKAAENYCAYLNASLQGLDKMARQLKNHPFLTTRRAAEIIALPTILLYMLNRDDEDYQHLNDRTKDNYYCIPTGKGTFIKIPKSREYGVAMGALLERFLRLRDGEDPETALDGIGGQFLTNIAPSNPFTDNIAKTIFIDLPTNQDFAGRSIIPERLANLSPENQYDYTTSKAGIAASKAWNATLGRLFPKMAPIQADYLIDSNLGFVGDMILGSTQQGSKSVKDVLKAVIAEPVARKMTADPLYQSGVTDAFYKELSEAETAANDKNLTEGLESRVITPEEKYLSALQASSSEISELRKREREILSDTTISKQEQEAQTREIRREINRIALGAKGKAEQERDAWAKTYVPEISHLTDEKQREARTAYEQNGTPYTDFVRYDDRYRLLQKDKETSSAADRAKLAGYLEGDDTLTDEQKEGLYEHLLIPYLSDSRKEDWDKTYKGKVAPSLFFEIANEYSQIGDELDDLEKGKAQAKATAFSMYLDGMGLSDDVRSQVENDFKYFNMNPAKSENYTFEMMRKNGGKNEQAYADALEQSGLSIETYYEIKDMKNAKDADGSYTYKKDDIVQEMRDKGFTTAQIGAVCGAFGWKAPSSSGSGKSSSSKKTSSSGSKSKSSSSSSTENTLRRLTGLPKLPKLGK